MNDILGQPLIRAFFLAAPSTTTAQPSGLVSMGLGAKKTRPLRRHQRIKTFINTYIILFYISLLYLFIISIYFSYTHYILVGLREGNES